jgi:hypothetical protein
MAAVPVTFRLRSDHPLLEDSQLLLRDMATISESSVFDSLFQSALEEYEIQAEINLVRHPLAAQLEHCNTVESITELLRGQAQAFHELRGGDNKVIALLQQTVQVLHGLFATVIVVESLDLVCPNG